MDREKLGDEKLKEIADEIENVIDLDLLHDIVKDNKIEFDFENEQYRVKLLNLKEKEELALSRLKEYTRLLQDKSFLFEVELIKIYKDRGINIDEMTKKFDELAKEERNIYLKLGEALKVKESEEILKSYREDIRKIRAERLVISIQKGNLLEASIETQLTNYICKYTTYLSLEKQDGDKWVKAFSNYNDFCNIEEKLLEKAGYFSLLVQNSME